MKGNMMATEQELFDKIWNFLKAQGKPAKQGPTERGLGTTCMYLTSDGLKCAVGCLIDDPKLAHRMDTNKVDGILQNTVMAVAHLLPEDLREHVTFLDKMQMAHDAADDYDGEWWENFSDRARAIAAHRQLTVPA